MVRYLTGVKNNVQLEGVKNNAQPVGVKKDVYISHLQGVKLFNVIDFICQKNSQKTAYIVRVKNLQPVEKVKF